MTRGIEGAGAVWHSGPPPHVGWWPASRNRYLRSLRWWNGAAWSDAAYPEHTAVAAARWAAFTAYRQGSIEWRDRPKDWPR